MGDTSSLSTRTPEKVTALSVDIHDPDLEFSPFHVTQMLHAHNGNHPPPFDQDIDHSGQGHQGHPDDHIVPYFDDAHSARCHGLYLDAYAHARAVHTTHDHPRVQCDHSPAPFHYAGPSHVLIQLDHKLTYHGTAHGHGHGLQLLSLFHPPFLEHDHGLCVDHARSRDHAPDLGLYRVLGHDHDPDLFLFPCPCPCPYPYRDLCGAYPPYDHDPDVCRERVHGISPFPSLYPFPFHEIFPYPWNNFIQSQVIKKKKN